MIQLIQCQSLKTNHINLLWGCVKSQLSPIKISEGVPTADNEDTLIGTECVSGDVVKSNHTIVKAGAGFLVLCDVATHSWRT